MKDWGFYKTYGAFSREDGKLCGYACLAKQENYIDFRNLKVIPEKEKYAINAAIVNELLMDNKELLETGSYICDGSRNIQHETAFQNYLEKYFGFRKAYCKLHIKYRSLVGLAVYILFPFRKLLKRFSSISIMRKVVPLLEMEEIRRSFL